MRSDKKHMKDKTASDVPLGASILDNDIENLPSLPRMIGAKRLHILSTLGLFLLAMVTYVTISRPYNGADCPQCRSIYMYPSYARIDGFDQRYTSLAKKYHLYLYREQGKDKVPVDGDEVQLNGIPVLFIPGNAGSFKQVRSIAAACSNLYVEGLETIDNPNAKNLDFFAADFNEDFTAFHGRTMIDQAEYLNDAVRYILSLYIKSADPSVPRPESVIIVGHSMGGMVARVIPTLQNYIFGSINTIITLSTPHAVAPVTFDGDILKIYQNTNDYWRAQFVDETSFFSTNMTLVSITGGILDTVLPADYASVQDILPKRNGFTTFTSTIPGVWTPIDHLAIVWCDQLRSVLAKLLMEIVDVTSPSKTKPLRQRMDVSKKLLLSGFEESTSDTVILPNPESIYKIIEMTEIMGALEGSEKDPLVVTGKRGQRNIRNAVVKIPRDRKEGDLMFSLLTSVEEINVNLCSRSTNSIENVLTTYLACVNINDRLARVPVTYTDPESTIPTSEYRILELKGKNFIDADELLIEFPPSGLAHEDFLLGKFQRYRHETKIGFNNFVVSIVGLCFNIDEVSNFTVTKLTSLWDSLISYKMKTTVTSDTDKELLFEPFFRQWISEPYESKWHTGLLSSVIDINMHNVVPFVPYKETHDKSLNFEMYVPPDLKFDITFHINWTLTMKQLFIRYRLAIGSFPVFFISSVMAYQFYWYNKTAIFIDFRVTLAHLLRKYGFWVACLLIALTPITDSRLVQKVLYALDPIRLNRPFALDNNGMHANYYYLGLRSFFPAGIGLLFGMITIGVLTLLYQIFNISEKIIRKCRKKCMKTEPGTKHMINQNIFDKKRTISALLMFLLVIFYIPYQLAFAIVLIVQLATFIRICLFVPESAANYYNLRNYNLTLCILFIFIGVINAPIIIVFLHNVAIRWETPFRSHHNVLAIAPMILLAGANSTFNMPRFDSNRLLDGGIAILVLSYLSFFSLIYGIRNMYWIHHIVNVLSGWLFFGYVNGNSAFSKSKFLGTTK